MAHWIEFHVALRDHIKVDRLAKKLGCNYSQALGHLACLWCWTAINSPDGNLKDFSDEELCKGARIEQDLNIKRTLIELQLMDRSNKIHDWDEHGIRYLESKRKNMQICRKRWHHRFQSVASTNQPTNQHTTEGLLEGEKFNEFWTAYPKKQGKTVALKAFLKVNPPPELFRVMLAAVETQKKTQQWQKDNGQFIPMPATWLNQKRWEDVTEVQAGVTPRRTIIA